MSKIILVIFTCMLSPALAQIPSRCFTPDEHPGSCIPFTSCQHLYDLVQKYPTNPRNRLYVSLSQCGLFDGKPYVCCKESGSPLIINNPPEILNKDIPKPGECGTFYDYRLISLNVTQLDDYPWLALLGYSKPQGKTGFHCGGALISRRYVLTSGRCVSFKSWKLTHVRLGEWNIESDEDCDESYVYEKICTDPIVDVKVAEIIPHPQYNPNDKNQFNDIALLRLEKDVQFSDFIKPICLPFDDGLRDNLFIKQTLEISGWGISEKQSSSTLKLKALVEGISSENCNEAYKNEQRQIKSDSQVCAGNNKQFTCRGDLGGPLMRVNYLANPPYYYVAGIASSDLPECGSNGKPEIYTRVGNYIDWIQATIKA